MQHNFNFKFSPKLIKFLGEELIHDKKIALVELVKNSYDADATEVEINFSDDKITISDNGSGMDIATIKNHWLVPGNSSKHENNLSPKLKRVPIGEKGIGRLGAHKLGNKILVQTKAASSHEVKFSIDWTAIETKENVQEIAPIEVLELESPEKFLTGTGTIIEISRLKEVFDDKEISSVKRDMVQILSPFNPIDENLFKIILTTRIGLFPVQEVLRVDNIIKKALFYFAVVIRQGTIQSFEFKAISPNPRKYKSKLIKFDKENLDAGEIKKKCKQTELVATDLGEVFFEGYIFDQSFSKALNNQFEDGTLDYLAKNGGIRVYRDGLRVYDYGEEGKDNDLLDLDANRAKKLGTAVGYKQILASVELKRSSTAQLREKTNREGFIHNEAFFSLKANLQYCLDLVLHYRNLERAELKTKFNNDAVKTDLSPELSEIHKTITTLKIPEKQQKKVAQLTKLLQEIEAKSERLKDTFLTSMNTGLNLTFVVHELEKLMGVLGSSIEQEDLINIEKSYLQIKETLSNYIGLIRVDKRKQNVVNDFISQAAFLLSYKLDEDEIDIQLQIEDNLVIKGKYGLLVGMIINLIDNASYWLNHYKIEEKKIIIKAYRSDTSIVIIVADNAQGFNMSFDSAVQQFTSGRLDESSLGIGLYLADQIMNAHNGRISLSNHTDEQLDEEFSHGGILKLVFDNV